MPSQYTLLQNAIIMDAECVSADTLVQLQDGSIIPIKDWGVGPIWGSGFDDTREAKFVEVFGAVQKEAKQLWRVRPKWGLPVRASAEHYFLTQDGWKPTRELTTSDYLLVAKSGPIGTHNPNLTKDKIEFLGWWIAEGCRSADQSKPSVAVSVVEEEYQELLPNPWPDLIKIVKTDNNTTRYSLKKIGRAPGGAYYKNPAAEFLKSYALLDRYSFEKEIPQELLRCSNEQISWLIGALWAGDGTVFSDRLGLSYTTTSHRLAEQVILLLARFGVLSSLSISEDNREKRYKTKYLVQISGESAIRFAEQIEIPGRKGRELQCALELFVQRQAQERIPSCLTEGWKERWLDFAESHDFRNTRSGNFQPWAKLKETCSISIQTSIYSGVDLSVMALREMAEVYPEVFEQYLDYVFEGMVWAPISSIDEDGFEEVWDLTTNTGEFFAGSVVVHNTTGLGRGSGIHQLALYDLERRKLYEYYVKPNLVITKSPIDQDIVKLASSPLDRHYGVERDTWKDLIREQVRIETGIDGSWDEIQDTLKHHNRFLYDKLQEGAYSYLETGQIPDATKAIKDAGIVRRAQETTMGEMLDRGSDFRKRIEGKTIWIANAPFEAKQIGAQIGAIEQKTGISLGVKDTLETFNPNSVDPFYVTGVEVNRARTKAGFDGDWTGVWKAMVANPPKAGETAVRDIQDVVRAFYSYGKKVGLTDIRNQNFGVGVDVTARLFGSLEKDPSLARKLLLTAEHHTAGEDVAISERYVLEKSVRYTTALEHVQEGTEEGRRLVALAKQGKGDLFDAQVFFARRDRLAPQMVSTSLAQRFERAHLDFQKEGKTVQVTGIEDIVPMAQQTPDGRPVTVVRNAPRRTEFTSMEQLVDHLSRKPEYAELGIDPRKVFDEMRPAMEAGNEHVSQFVFDRKASLAKTFDETADEILRTVGRADYRLPTSNFLRNLNIPTGKVGLGVAVAAGVVGTLGTMWGGSHSQMVGGERNLLAYDYDQWTANQEQFFGQQPYHAGMQESGVGGQTRKQQTDFGSPYRGPFVSNQVLLDQELLQERERFMREKFGAEHYDPQFGLFSKLNFGRGGYDFIKGSGIERVDGQEYGLRGKNLLGIDFNSGHWKMSADDADTILVQRAGVRGAIQSFFGMNKGYAFRLEGIDSPETYHGDDQGFKSAAWKAPQPYADESTEVFQNILRQGGNKLVFDPSETTYGRMIGVVFQGKKNINLELVKRGAAGHLPFGRTEDSMVDHSQFAAAETRAHASNRGMWAEPWAQTYKAATLASRDKITFNTFTRREKLAENASLMSLASLMEDSQNRGFASPSALQAAGELGTVLKARSFRADYKTPDTFRTHNAPHNNYLEQMMVDHAGFMRTHGTGQNGDRFSRRGGYGELDGYMALDTMNTTNAVWDRRKLASFDAYGVKSTNRLARRQAMAEQQRKLNQTVFASGIGHNQM